VRSSWTSPPRWGRGGRRSPLEPPGGPGGRARRVCRSVARRHRIATPDPPRGPPFRPMRCDPWSSSLIPRRPRLALSCGERSSLPTRPESQSVSLLLTARASQGQVPSRAVACVVRNLPVARGSTVSPPRIGIGLLHTVNVPRCPRAPTGSIGPYATSSFPNIATKREVERSIGHRSRSVRLCTVAMTRPPEAPRPVPHRLNEMPLVELDRAPGLQSGLRTAT